ncbi:MAG: glycosyltransferase family 2 protein [Candidatus Azobacteroides sp.]|nr:glycosyltransferase family 2 protein [Candidatus Azobacteroides sp.]
MEVFVVDNNSTDGSQEYITSRFPSVIYLLNKDNPGFATAANQGIRKCQGEYILLLNPDTVLGENVLENVCTFMDAHPEAGGAGVKMINGYGEFLPESKRGFPSPWSFFWEFTGIARLFPYFGIFSTYYLRYLNANKIHEVNALSGAFMMIRRSVLDKTGYLDESFFMYGEALDLSCRITKAGFKNYYLPERIIHYKGQSTGLIGLENEKILSESMNLFFEKYNPSQKKLFSYFMSVAIRFRKIATAVKRITNIRNRKEIDDTTLMEYGMFTYEEMIQQMDESEFTAQYLIYSPRSGMIVGSRSVEKCREPDGK